MTNRISGAIFGFFFGTILFLVLFLFYILIMNITDNNITTLSPKIVSSVAASCIFIGIIIGGIVGVDD